MPIVTAPADVGASAGQLYIRSAAHEENATGHIQRAAAEQAAHQEQNYNHNNRGQRRAHSGASAAAGQRSGAEKLKKAKPITKVTSFAMCRNRRGDTPASPARATAARSVLYFCIKYMLLWF